MASEIEELITRKIESANLDYKEGFIWEKQNRDLQLELIKDIMAMANTRDGIVRLSEFEQNLGHARIHNSLIVQHSGS